MNPWSPVAPCTPQDCLAGTAPSVGRVRRWSRYAAAAGVVLAGLVLTAPVMRLPAPHRHRAVRWWARAITGAFGVRTRISGVPATAPAGGMLLVANHVSWLDVLLAAAVRPGRMLAKAEVRRWPVLGRLAAAGGTLFVDRHRLRGLPGTVAGITAALRGGSTVVAFPEGTTWCGRPGGPFRRAVFQAALDAGVPVQPVAVGYRLADGTPTTVASFVGEDTLLASVRRVAGARGLVAEVTVLPPIPAGAHRDRRDLARAARAAVDGATDGTEADTTAQGSAGQGRCGWEASAPVRSSHTRSRSAARSVPTDRTLWGTVALK
ncbi:lysophospholipid acyltransferase family protein [Streptomyces thermolineatus]|uniref:lysophospholipid acyltransferase family protein n=1 Tax=Streptomyces thermolineatus TaxID=44033 RepID=UPI003850AAE4